MSTIKKMNRELEDILGREPTIHEQIDVLILSAIKERIYELQLTLQLEPMSDDMRDQYDFAMERYAEVRDRNLHIFGNSDSDGGDYE